MSDFGILHIILLSVAILLIGVHILINHSTAIWLLQRDGLHGKVKSSLQGWLGLFIAYGLTVGYFMLLISWALANIGNAEAVIASSFWSAGGFVVVPVSVVICALSGPCFTSEPCEEPNGSTPSLGPFRKWLLRLV